MTQIAPVDLVTVEKNTIYLNSNLDETMFGKTKFSLLLNENGIMFSKNENNQWVKKSDWKFNEIKTKDLKVFFCGNFSGESLQSKIEKSSSDLNEYLYTICEIYVYCIKNKVTIPCNGPYGIIINSEEERILFLPEKTFDKSSANLGKSLYDYFQNNWRDYVAENINAEKIALGILSYFAIAKSLPFSEEKDRKISDRNFLPLEYALNGINKKLADEINSLLGNSSSKFNFSLEELKNELFYSESKNHRISENRFEENTKKYLQKKEAKLKKIRFIRRNWPKALALFIFIIFSTITGYSIYRENGKKPCVIGLSSGEVTQVFYKGIHTMDTDLILAAAKDCPEAQKYVSKIPQIYVTGQMRSAYNFDSGISTPENWMFFEPDSTKSYSHYIYGITNFIIDGTESALDLQIPTKRNHPSRKIYAEDGSKNKIENSPDALHFVKYFLVHNQDNQIAIEEVSAKVTLRYVEKAWTITKIEQTSSIELISPLPVSLSYKKALAEHDGNVIKAVNYIRPDYKWLPAQKSLEIEEKRLEKIGY